MDLRDACASILDQMRFVVGQVTDDDFVRPSHLLSNVTLGQHLRHTIEFFLCLESGFRSGTVSYDKRNHDKLIETDRSLALMAIDRIREFILGCEDDRLLKLEVGYDRQSDETVFISTNYHRELVYNIEHAVHHMALMKVGVNEVAPYVKLPEGFGVAISTLRYGDMVARMS
jgi:hypothetical protein